MTDNFLLIIRKEKQNWQSQRDEFEARAADARVHWNVWDTVEQNYLQHLRVEQGAQKGPSFSVVAAKQGRASVAPLVRHKEPTNDTHRVQNNVVLLTDVANHEVDRRGLRDEGRTRDLFEVLKVYPSGVACIRIAKIIGDKPKPVRSAIYRGMENGAIEKCGASLYRLTERLFGKNTHEIRPLF